MDHKDNLITRWQTFIDTSPMPLLEVRCVTDGHGGLLLAVYAFDGTRVVVTDMHDSRWRLVDQSHKLAPPESSNPRFDAWKRGERVDTGRGDLRVPGFDDPIVTELDGTRFPRKLRCAKHGEVTIDRAQLDERLAIASTRRKLAIRVHPRPSGSG